MDRGVRRGWRALRHRNYRLFFAAQFVSMSGTWMQQVALSWLVLDLTNDPFMLGLVAAAQFGPVVFIGLIGGLLADHLSKRVVLAAAAVVQMGLSVGLLILAVSEHIQVWQVLSIAGLQGVAHAVELPARQSFIVELVGRDDLINAAGLTSVTINLGQLVGPAVAGLVIGVAGIPTTFLLNALTFIPMLVAMVAIRERELMRPSAQARPATFGELRRGLADGPRFVAGQPVVRTVIVVLGVVATFGISYRVLVPPLARDVLDLEATGFAVMMTASGVGSLAAAMIVVFARRMEPRAMALSATALGVALLVLALSRSFVVSLAAITAAGAGAIGMTATGNTFVQLSVPDTLRGRVMSIWTIVFGASVPVGGLLLGAVAARAGVAVALALGGIVSVGAALASLAWYRRYLARQCRQRATGEVAESNAGAACSGLAADQAPDVARTSDAAERPSI